jgi:hypothetical protein
MTAATGQAWRGIAAEDADEITASLSALLRRRGRRLLQDLLRPHRRRVLAILVLIVTANLGALAGPWLVGVGVDRIAAVVDGHALGPLVPVIVALRRGRADQAVPPAASSRPWAASAAWSCWSCGPGCSPTSSGCRWPSTSGTPRAG